MSEPTPRPLDHRELGRPSVEELLAHRKLWPVAAAAALLGCHRIRLYKRAQAGTIQLVKIGRRTYVTAEELDRHAQAAAPFVPGRRAAVARRRRANPSCRHQVALCDIDVLSP